MTEQPSHEYMDTGALTEDAVPPAETAPQPPIEAPGSESSVSAEVDQNPGDQPESVGSMGGPADSTLPAGAEVVGTTEEAQQ